MARFAPQFNLYKIIDKLSALCDLIFWSVFALSVVPALFKVFTIKFDISTYADILNIICIVLFFILDTIIDHVLIPLAEAKRNDDFVDNSFNSQFSLQNSDGYFDNDEVKHGLYKAAVNMFENSFFTYSLLKRNTVNKTVVPALTFTIILVSAYFGFQHVPFALSLLQILFSTNLLGALIKHLILVNKLSVIFDDWMKLFQLTDFDSSATKYDSYIFRNWLRYETLIAKIPAKIPAKIFDKYNPILTQDWVSLKQKLNIK